MQIRELKVPGAFEITPKQFGDPRGVFLEWFKAPELEAAIGHRFELKQVNFSTSLTGTVRGIHFAEVPPGQAKYVMCTTGAVLDVVVDIRVGSPTFGMWDAVLLDDVDRRAVYVSEGIGHGFISLEDGSTVMYLCSAGYNPTGEHGVHPLDPDVGIVWPTTDRHGNPIEPLLSEKDEAAPALAEAASQGLLPDYAQVLAYIESLRD